MYSTEQSTLRHFYNLRIFSIGKFPHFTKTNGIFSGKSANCSRVISERLIIVGQCVAIVNCDPFTGEGPFCIYIYFFVEKNSHETIVN